MTSENPRPPGSLEELRDLLRAFVSERDWQEFHNPKNLAMALAGEAGELAAEFQWLTPEQARNPSPEERERAAAEMADVLNYLVHLADSLDVNLLEAADAKIRRNALKYPAP